MLTRRDFLGLVSAAGALAALDGCAGTAPERSDDTWTPNGTFDRLAVLRRHDPVVRSMTRAPVLSVGNGNFAFNVDCTGLQSLPGAYNVIPLATLSDWAWHSMPPPKGKTADEMKWDKLRLKSYSFHGRQVAYATDSSGQAELFNAENPHRLSLGRIGLVYDSRLSILRFPGLISSWGVQRVITSRFVAGAR